MTSRVLLALAALSTTAGCSTAEVASSDIEDIPTRDFADLRSSGLVVGKLGPGAPPNNTLPSSVTLVFTQGDRSVEVTAKGGQYRAELPPGSWKVRSTDALACASGLDATVGALHRYDLVYPLQGCQDLSAAPDSALEPPAAEAPH